VIDDGSADVDASFVFASRGIGVFDDDGFGFSAGGVGNENKSSIGSKLAEDEFHDEFEEVVAVEGLAGDAGEFVDDTEVFGGGGGGIGDGHDDGVFGGRHSLFDDGVHEFGSEGSDGVVVRAVFSAAEDEDGRSGADLVAEAELDSFFSDSSAVDVGSVGATEVADEPVSVVGSEFSVSSGAGFIGGAERFAGPSDELGFPIGEFESFSLVGSFDDFEDEGCGAGHGFVYS